MQMEFNTEELLTMKGLIKMLKSHHMHPISF